MRSNALFFLLCINTALAVPNRRIGNADYGDVPLPTVPDDLDYGYGQNGETDVGADGNESDIPVIYVVLLDDNDRQKNKMNNDDDEDELVADNGMSDDSSATSTLMPYNSDPSEDTSNATVFMTFPQFLAANICKSNIARMCFEEADSDGDGLVSPQELSDYKRRGMARAEKLYSGYLQHSFEEADVNHDGYISRQEASQFAESNLKIVPDNAFNIFFDKMDVNQDGKLDKKEFDKFMEAWYRNDYDLHFTYNDYATTTEETAVITSQASVSQYPLDINE